MRFWRLRSRRDERGKTCFQFPCLWCCLWHSDCPGHTMGHLDWTDIDNWHRVSWLCPAPASSDCPGVIYTLAIVTTLTILRDTQSRERDTHKLFLLGNWKLTVTRERERERGPQRRVAAHWQPGPSLNAAWDHFHVRCIMTIQDWAGTMLLKNTRDASGMKIFRKRKSSSSR